jgi:hypothetical protein
MRSHLRIKAWILLVTFCYEIFTPVSLFALTSGPSQPEMVGFTPIGVTEMVDPFTGDFSYNLPLMEVEGYPINIAYNSGISMEQEATWVGLGWNLNVGAINRSVRGLPDDFKGDLVTTKMNMKPMQIRKFALGASTEIFGLGPLSNMTFIHNNYKGFGISSSNSLSTSLGSGGAQIGAQVGFTLNTLEGTTSNASLGFSISQGTKFGTFGSGGSLGTGYNTRTGQSELSFGLNGSYSTGIVPRVSLSANVGYNYSFLPIGLQTYTPYSTIKTKQSSFTLSLGVGGEVWGVYLNGKTFGSNSIQELKTKDFSTSSFGYLYAGNARSEDLKDFNREKNVTLNKTISYLSPTCFTYDVYSVTGDGVSGMFRPFRNDYGMLSEPTYNYKNVSSSTISAEVGLGAFVKAGLDVGVNYTTTEYGPWEAGNYLAGYQFKTKKENNTFEPFYFKAAGDLTEIDVEQYEKVGNDEAVALELLDFNQMTKSSLEKEDGSTLQLFPKVIDVNRQVRSKLLTFLTAKDAANAGLEKQISYYTGSNSTNNLSLVNEARVNGFRKDHHISEFTQINPDGDRFIYGIPAYNKTKLEVTYNSSASAGGAEDNIKHISTQASTSNKEGVDHFYSKIETAPYAHSFLLTAKQSPDYQDVTGDGVSSDDLGQAYKFNYTRTSTNYKWRAPYDGDSYLDGFKSDDLDEKGSYTYGEKELWYVHSIESKNQICEFRISLRDDGVGVAGEQGGIDESGSATNRLYKLDSIVLYNKYDRVKNGVSAIPIKKVIFEYDYSMCENVMNNRIIIDGNTGKRGGKLTLKSVQVCYGNNKIGSLSPYTFDYANGGGNPDYQLGQMDRWGNYQKSYENPNHMKNSDYPYSNQNGFQNELFSDTWARAWTLTEIILPSGGKINIEYESDDYAYVQNKKAMQMFPILGIGSTVNDFAPVSPKNNLYNNHFLFFKKPADVPISELKKRFFNGKNRMDNMYFKVLTNIEGTKTEYVSGYVNALDLGAHPTQSDYFWVLIEPSAPNSISEIAWAYFRYNLNHILTKQPTVSDSGFESLIKGLVANIADIQKLIGGVNSKLQNDGVAKHVGLERSFVRLFNPNGFKKGGGSRVKSIAMNDSWNTMSLDANDSDYGQEYDYTKLDENNNIISSGVASYEPAIGNDENPFREPAPHVAVGAQGHVPAIPAYQERPMGESFFPGASVGYSKVTVKDKNFAKGKTNNSITEYEFFTNLDFPYFVSNTDIDYDESLPPRGNINLPLVTDSRKTAIAFTQGFSIILNDMHGKPRSVKNFGLFEDESNPGSFLKKIITGAEYEYHSEDTPKGKKLKNKVDVLSKEGLVVEKILGEEFDITIDSQRSFEELETYNPQVNVDVIPIPILIAVIPLPIVMPKYNRSVDITESKTVVITKVVQKYGLIKSVRNFTDQYSTTTFNELYDGQTGRVLLTKSEDGYKQPEYQFNVPTYLDPNQLRMGGAYENALYTASVKPVSGVLGKYINDGNLKHGDEVLLKNGVDPAIRAWVSIEDKDPFIKSKCTPYKVLQVSGDYTMCSSSANPYPSSFDYSDLISPRSDIRLFHLKDEFADYINTEVDNHNTAYFSNHGVDAPAAVAFNFIESKLCTLKSTVNVPGYQYPYNLLSTGLPNIPTMFNFRYNPKFRINSFRDIEVATLFDFKDPMTGIATFPTGSNNFPQLDFVYTPRVDKYFQTGQFLLIEYKHNKLVNGNTITELAYFMTPVQSTLQFSGGVVNYLFPNTANFWASLTPNYPSYYYSLIDEAGVEIGIGGSDAKITVIRSGNRNMLTANNGTIKSLDYPLDVDGQTKKLIGIKSGIRLMDASAQGFSDRYDMNSPYQVSTENTFLTTSDGSFKPDSLFTFQSSRFQSADIELPKDGYIETLASLWVTSPNPCAFTFDPPSFNTSGGGGSGWFYQQKNTKYNYEGQSIEGKNNLDNYSAVKLNLEGKVQVEASNSKQKHFAVEDFENYYGLVSQGASLKNDFSILSKSTGNSFPNSVYPFDEILPHANSNFLVKGVAHSGNYSMFLQGDYLTSSSSPITIDYTEESLNSLITEDLSAANKMASKQEIITSPLSTRNNHINNFKSDLSPQSIADIDRIIGYQNSSNRVVTLATNNNDPDPFLDLSLKAGGYTLSVWVKELLTEGTVYAGLGDNLQVNVNSNIPAQSPISVQPIISTPIDGWRKFEFIFNIEETDQLEVVFMGGYWGAFFDDFRILPIESNINTYVYDKVSGRLTAKLDENNLATFFEYNNQGIPSQVKRETDKGILTISETKQSIKK